ncbi:MAG TPA: K(+)-transporting ATPase subunit F [Verrucomicrobiales bacterium]|nr:K(+)-transporting ATPase subunit F [Verrucomicrobiales bacterium]
MGGSCCSKRNRYDRYSLHRRRRGLLPGRGALRPVLQQTLTPAAMETAPMGIVALLLFIYLLTAMLRPEKF